MKGEKTAIVVNGSIFRMQCAGTRSCLCILNRGWHTRGVIIIVTTTAAIVPTLPAPLTQPPEHASTHVPPTDTHNRVLLTFTAQEQVERLSPSQHIF